jgi:hypothetical protein
MNQDRRVRSRGKERSAVPRTQSDSKKLFLETMKRRLDETMSEARLQRDKKKFFFLKGGLDVPPDQEDGLAPEHAKVREAKRSKTRSQPDQRRNEISAIQDRILQSAIKSDFRKQILAGDRGAERKRRSGRAGSE